MNEADKPLRVISHRYVSAHLALDLVDDEGAEAILNHCEDHLEEGS
jgi:hypothetical protein